MLELVQPTFRYGYKHVTSKHCTNCHSGCLFEVGNDLGEYEVRQQITHFLQHS